MWNPFASKTVEKEQETDSQAEFDKELQDVIHKSQEVVDAKDKCSMSRASTVSGISHAIHDKTQRTMRDMTPEQLAEWEAKKEELRNRKK